MVYLGIDFMVGNEIGMHRICFQECGLLLRFTDGLAYGSIKVLMGYFFLINSTGFPPKSSTHNGLSELGLILCSGRFRSDRPVR